MSTLSGIRTDARRLINETDSANTHFSDTVFTSWANMWARDLAVRILWPRAEATVDGGSVLNQETYALPSDFLSLIKLFFNVNGNGEVELYPAAIEDMHVLYGRGWKGDAAGVPQHYYFPDTDVLGIHPKPDSNNASKTIRLVYVIQPAALSADTDTPDLPTTLHDTAQYFMAAIAHQSIGNADMHKKLMADYIGFVTALKGKIGAQSQELNSWRWAATEEQ